jgi:hypothetical protein
MHAQHRTQQHTLQPTLKGRLQHRFKQRQRHTIAIAALCLAAGSTLLTSHASARVVALQDGAATKSIDFNEMRQLNWAVVTTPDTSVRCGPTARYYSVASLDEGALVRIVGARDGTTLIEYPSQAGVVVDARSVGDLNPDGTRLILSEPSALRALNADRGLAGSWRSALDDTLPAGTELAILEVLASADGSSEPAGYRVAPPTPATGYIPSGAVRAATQAEIDIYLTGMFGAQDLTTAPPTPIEDMDKAGELIDGETVRTTDASSPDAVDTIDDNDDSNNNNNNVADGVENNAENTASNAADTGDETEQARRDNSKTTDALDGDAIAGNGDGNADSTTVAAPDADIPSNGTDAQEMADTSTDSAAGSLADSPADAAIRRGDESTPPSDRVTTEVVEPAGIDPAINDPMETDPGEAAAPPRPVLSYNDLTAAFIELRAEPEILDDAIDELIVEYERTLATLTNERERVGAGARLEWLQLKRDIRDRRAELAAVRAESAQDDESTIARLNAIAVTTNDYAVVGRLASSRVYDGVRLPLMYRVVSIDPVRPGDTIGYVRPGQGGDLERFLGRVVGASGVTSYDADLGLRIIAGDVVTSLPQLEN